jgi:hypothetical protein
MSIVRRLEKLEKRMGRTDKNLITMAPEAFKRWLVSSTVAERKSGLALLEAKVSKLKPMELLRPNEVNANLDILYKFFAMWNFDRDPEMALAEYEDSCHLESDLLTMTPDEIQAKISAMDAELVALEAKPGQGKDGAP